MLLLLIARHIKYAYLIPQYGTTVTVLYDFEKIRFSDMGSFALYYFVRVFYFKTSLSVPSVPCPCPAIVLSPPAPLSSFYNM